VLAGRRTTDQDLAGRRIDESVEHTQQRALAAAALADQNNRLSARYREIDPTQGVNPTGVGHGDLPGL
jgi:hypothetical protein